MDKKITVSMRDFINGPYIKCPKCGENSFGILGIYRNQYSRRCSECFYPHPRNGEDSVTVSLPPLNKKIIYLDQMAISEMAKFLNPSIKASVEGKISPFWGDLFGRLDELFKLHLIISPDSNFHKYESLLASFYAPLKRIYEHLSGGVSFYDHWTIQRFQILYQLKEWLGEKEIRPLNVYTITDGEINAWMDTIRMSVAGYESQDLIDELKTNREKIDEGIQEVFKLWQIEKDKDFNYWFEQEREAEANLLIQQHIKWLENLKESLEGSIPFHASHFFPDMATTLFQSIRDRCREKGIPEEDLNNNLYKFLKSDKFKDTPFIVISSLLHAAMARSAANGRKKLPTKGYMNDVHIISTLLPYCDAMFVDNEFRSFLNENPIRDEINKYGTKIFSFSNKEEFMDYLDSIKLTVSSEHLKMIQEVYGEDWIKPYWGIIQDKGESC